MDQPWSVKKCNWYCPIQTKAKYGRDVVFMRPAIVVTFLNISIPPLLKIKLEAVHCCPAVCKKWAPRCKGFFKQVYFLHGGDAHSCKRVIPKCLDEKAHTESQINRKISIGKTKNKLQRIQQSPGECPY